MAKEPIFTCQICERAIKIVKGWLWVDDPKSSGKKQQFSDILAHHGYQRPWGEGWQTESCQGARNLPYEVSCALIPPVIEMVKKYIVNVKALQKEWHDNPPAELAEPIRWKGHVPEKVSHPKPADFDPDKNSGSFNMTPDGRYRSIYAHFVYRRKTALEQAERGVKRLEKRVADWKPPANEKAEIEHQDLMRDEKNT